MPFKEVWHRYSGDGVRSKSIASVIEFIEKRLGGMFVFPATQTDQATANLLALAERMKRHGSIQYYGKNVVRPDEIPLYYWHAAYGNIESSITGEHPIAGGSSLSNEHDALIATLAEAIERHVWRYADDHYVSRFVGTVAQAEQRGLVLNPRTVVAFSEEQRSRDSRLTLSADSVYEWTSAWSWAQNKPLWVPAQLVTGSSKAAASRKQRNEPTITSPITHGLATRQTKKAALLYGALELIERDAFMIVWLNHIPAPQYDLEELAKGSPTLAHLLQQCKRYRFKASAVRLLTDAPTYAALGVLEDTTGGVPAITVGLKAHLNPAKAVEGALLEAVRIRRFIRNSDTSAIASLKPQELGHTDRLLYWSDPSRKHELSFLTQGPVQRFTEPWEQDSEEEHLGRILAWCRAQGHEFASVSLTHSKLNSTPWHIEKVLMPNLQQLHLDERLPYISGPRLKAIPEYFGYTPLSPVSRLPHPFS